VRRRGQGGQLKKRRWERTQLGSAKNGGVNMSNELYRLKEGKGVIRQLSEREGEGEGRTGGRNLHIQESS